MLLPYTNLTPRSSLCLRAFGFLNQIHIIIHKKQIEYVTLLTTISCSVEDDALLFYVIHT